MESAVAYRIRKCDCSEDCESIVMDVNEVTADGEEPATNVVFLALDDEEKKPAYDALLGLAAEMSDFGSLQ